MSIIDIKKALYHLTPTATYLHCRKSTTGEAYLVYGCRIDCKAGPPDLFFEVPVSELEPGLFHAIQGAQLLIRYIVQPETTQP